MACCSRDPKETKCCAKSAVMMDSDVRASVKQYYGQEVKSKDDIQTSVNCTMFSNMAAHVRQALSLVHDEVINRYFGCGLVIPEALEGCSVLDLGSGSGRDCFAMSKLVGASGQVVGVDMTEEQLALARKHVDYHTEKFGYSQPNVRFVTGYIENLTDAGLKDNTFDIIISNCVVNLSPDKKAVLTEAYRVLKEGGELYFSDIYTDTYLSDDVRKHRVLWGECISGALHWQDLYQVAQQVGFSQPRLVTAKMVNVSQFADLLGEAQFVSVTYRLFKLPATERAASHVTYNGGILGNPDKLPFDHAVTFQANSPLAVDGELAAILSSSRFAPFFTFSDTGAVTSVTPDPKVDPFPKAKPVDPSTQSPCCS